MSLLALAEDEIIKQGLPDCSGKLCLLFHFFPMKVAKLVFFFVLWFIETFKIYKTQGPRLHCRFLPFFLKNLNPHLSLSFY